MKEFFGIGVLFFIFFKHTFQEGFGQELTISSTVQTGTSGTHWTIFTNTHSWLVTIRYTPYFY